jgi:outer membrane protein assembly factor BamD
MKNITLFSLFALLIGISSCSDYNEVLKSEDYGRKFDMANTLYGTDSKSQKGRSIALYEQVYQRLPKEPEGEVAYFRIGKAYYQTGDLYMAGYYLGNFPQRFPYSPKSEEALFLSAMCSVENSPQYTLDQQETEIAINNLQQFVNRYPKSDLVDSCNNIIDRLYFKIESKAYDGVKLYDKTMNYRAAASAAFTFIEDYPLSVFSEEIHYVMVKNSYYLAKNSVDTKKVERIENTLERYSTFVSGFPESKYLSQLAGYNDEMKKEMQLLKPEK